MSEGCGTFHHKHPNCAVFSFGDVMLSFGGAFQVGLSTFSTICSLLNEFEILNECLCQ